MAMFNLADYETVEERIKRFYAAYPDGRIITEDLTNSLDRQVSTWRVKTTIFLTDADQERGLPKATGHAFEVDGSGGANKTSAWENAETSSIGRALANMGMSGNKRSSREEMAKVVADVTPVAPARPWLVEAEELAKESNLPALRELYATAVRLKISQPIIDGIAKIANGVKGSSDTAG